MAMRRMVDERALVGVGGAFGGTLGLYAALGIGLGILAFSVGVSGAALVADPAAQPTFAGVGLALVAGILPLVAAPFVALGAGAWCGTASRDGGTGFVVGAFGSILGTLLMLVFVGVGFALGAAASGLDLDAFRAFVGISPDLGEMSAFLMSVAGLLYLVAIGLVGGVSGFVVGVVMPKPVVERAPVAERPVV